MYDHSYNFDTLAAMLRRSDFPYATPAATTAFRKAKVSAAVVSAAADFSITNPLESFHLQGKQAFRCKFLEDELVVRKLAKNILKAVKPRRSGRDRIVGNLIRILEEGVRYRVYRLDVKAFYESFSHVEVCSTVHGLREVSPKSKRQLGNLLSHYAALGGSGVPRGMGISAVLSELMMQDFDAAISRHPKVFFYARYVDDILVVTNGLEDVSTFRSEIQSALPPGLSLNPKKSATISLGVSDPKDIWPPGSARFSYLGYSFEVRPLQHPKKKGDFRDVQVEIAPEKVLKIKRRVLRSFLDFSRTGDANLLLDRVKFLTSNFHITDVDNGRKRLAGIYYGFPLLSGASGSLSELDATLRSAAFGHVRASAGGPASLWPALRRSVLGRSFVRGHAERTFIHFSPQKISTIQECWIYG